MKTTATLVLALAAAGRANAQEASFSGGVAAGTTSTRAQEPTGSLPIEATTGKVEQGL